MHCMHALSFAVYSLASPASVTSSLRTICTCSLIYCSFKYLYLWTFFTTCSFLHALSHLINLLCSSSNLCHWRKHVRVTNLWPGCVCNDQPATHCMILISYYLCIQAVEKHWWHVRLATCYMLESPRSSMDQVHEYREVHIQCDNVCHWILPYSEVLNKYVGESEANIRYV